MKFIAPNRAGQPVIGLELCFLFDCAFRAHEVRRDDLVQVYAHAAEGVIKATVPQIADVIALAAARKGNGGAIGERLVIALTPALAAAAAVALTVRGARRPAIDALTAAFGNEPEFVATVKMLCGRLFEPVRVRDS